MFQIGKKAVDFIVLVGTGKHTFRVQAAFHPKEQVLPAEIQDLVLRNTPDYEARGAYNGLGFRVQDFEVLEVKRPTEGRRVERVLSVEFGIADYFTFLTVNVGLDDKVLDHNGEPSRARL